MARNSLGAIVHGLWPARSVEQLESCNQRTLELQERTAANEADLQRGRSKPTLCYIPTFAFAACVCACSPACWLVLWFAGDLLFSFSKSTVIVWRVVENLHEACPRTQAIPEARSEKVGLLGAGATASAVTREQRTPVRACPGCHQRLACRA